jgi:hypothetical protein
MRLGEVVPSQSADYGQYHQTRRNLLVHIVAVPLVLVGSVLVLAGLLIQMWWFALGALALSLLAFAAQGVGHKGEPIPPVPFTGAGNALARIVVEQWVTFPRFVVSGGWAENYRRSGRPAGSRPS